MFNIEEELKKLPNSPGVYIMHDDSDAIIYVGKAKSLTKRVHQYFQASHDEGIKKKQMVEHIAYFEYIVVDSELEALVLENNLIKEHRPKYNTLLRDDKTYPYIKVSLEEDFPRVLFSRRMKKDNNKYFGPFTSADSVRETIDLVQKLYMIRTCNRKFPECIGKERPCLNYDMKQCSGPCTGHVTKEEYKVQVDKAISFLSGNYHEEEENLLKKMNEASERLDFEQAAKYRDLLESVRFCMSKQKITSSDEEDRDIVAMAHDEEDAVIQVFFIRNGRMIGRDHYHMAINVEDESTTLLASFIRQYYSGTPFIPHEIFVQENISEKNVIEEWLSEKRGKPVHIVIPVRGQKEKLVSLAEKNASLILSQDKERIKREEGRTIGAMKEISALLKIPGLVRMEAYDISNTSGFNSVGSMVVFENGKPKRSDYRKFRLKTVEGPNDYASMREVLTRRFLHGEREREEFLNSSGNHEGNNLLSEQPPIENSEVTNSDNEVVKQRQTSFSKFPDIIMMDGGKGQVHIAEQVLYDLGLHIPVAGMVKDDHHRTRGLYFHDEELPIDRSSEGFKLITRLQDEAHRFAIEYHRSLRSKEQVHSFLEDIEGIGHKRRRALMREFDSAMDMEKCSVEDFMKIPEMDRKSSEALYKYFHKKTEKPDDLVKKEDA